MKRPLFTFALLLMAGMAALARWGLWLALAAVPGGVFLAMLLPGWEKRRRDALLGCVCAAFLSAVLVLGVFDARLAHAAAYKGTDISFTGYVAETSAYDSALALVRADSPQLGRADIWMTSYDEDGLEAGDWIAGEARITGARADGRSFLSGGVTLTARSTGLRLTQPGRGLLWRAARLRGRLAGELLDAHPAPGTQVLAGLLFSEQSRLEDSARRAMERAGTAHLLSVSGLHLSIAVGWVLWVCGRLGLGRWTTLATSAACVLLLCAMAGFRTSVLRAAVMTLLWLLGRAIGRRSDSLTSLGAAACVLVVLCPPALDTAGFRMSFCATLGVAALAGPLTDGCVTWWEGRFGRRDGWVRDLCAALAVPLSAQVGLAPVFLLETGYLPVYGVAANMAVSVLVWPALLLGALAALCLWLAGPAAPALLLLDGASWLCQGILAICRFFAGLPFAVLPLQLPHQWGAVLGMAGAVAACVLLRLEGRRLGRVLGVSLALCLGLGLGGALYTRDKIIVTAAPGGTVAVRRGSMAVLLYGGEDQYSSDRTEELLLRAGLSDVELRVLARPWDATPQGDLRAALTFGPRVLLAAPAAVREGLPRPLDGVEVLPLSATPVEVWPGALLSAPGDGQTLLDAGREKVLKCWAGYGIITEADLPPDLTLLVDLAGNMYSPGRRAHILRLWTGDSVAVLKGE